MIKASLKSAIHYFLFLSLTLYLGCKQTQSPQNASSVIGDGEMPNLASDKTGHIHLVYGHEDSIFYAMWGDQGESFSKPVLVATLPKLFATAMRGPQIAFSEKGLTILAADKTGDIYSYLKDETGNWTRTGKVNDRDTVSKEGLMALDADGPIAFAVWLDLRDKHNKIFGALSTDGGKSWSKNKLIYASPDSTVCECCKPSVAVRGNHVSVMFRNWLNGNRDLYLIESNDGGNQFGEAKKLGSGNWALDGCPMDGGGLVIDKNGSTETVWRRKNIIYACKNGESEIAIGEGKSCVIESVNQGNVYAWSEKGDIIFLNPQQVKLVIGKGSLPIIRAINDRQVICVWENDNKIQTARVGL